MPLTGRLEFSPDPLSDTSPTWTDITSDLRSIRYWAGQDHELEDPKAGGAEIHLKNTNRRFEPDYVAGAFYPNIDTERRFRFFLNDGTGDVQEGLWYAADYDITYPAGTDYSEVVVTCVDGFGLLSLDQLGPLDPPDATSYSDVVLFDKPFAYYPLDERRGTKMAAATGPDGTYKSLPLLGQPGLTVGEDGTAVLFESGDYGVINLDQNNHFSDRNAASLGVWAKPGTLSGQITVLNGPEAVIGGVSMVLTLETGPFWRVHFEMGDGTDVQVASTTAPSTSRADHLMATWDGATARLYVNAVEEGSTTVGGKTLSIATAPTSMSVMAQGGWPVGMQMTAQKAVFYEYALSPERILAHYEAGTVRGYATELAGERIAAAATSDLWAETGIQVGHHEVQPVMHTGQSPLDEINAVVKAERPHALFFFNGEGDPVYLGWEYKATGSYSTVQAVFGDVDGEVRYRTDGLELDFDNEVYNIVTGSREGGELLSVTDATSVSDRKQRARSDETSLLLTEDVDVTAVLNAILAEYKQPALRPTSVSTTSGHALAPAQILIRDIGDLIRVRRRGEGGTPIDRITHILGKEKEVVPLGGNNVFVTCTYRLARGFNAAAGYWRLGISGFTELGETAVLG